MNISVLIKDQSGKTCGARMSISEAELQLPLAALEDRVFAPAREAFRLRKPELLPDYIAQERKVIEAIIKRAAA